MPTAKQINDIMQEGARAHNPEENPHTKYSQQWNTWLRGFNNARIGLK